MFLSADVEGGPDRSSGDRMDAMFVAFAVCGFFAVRSAVKNLVFRTLAAHFHILQVEKFVEMGWYFLYYVAFTFFGLIVYLHEEWLFPPTTNFWTGWPFHSFSAWFRVYYLLELSFYCHAALAIAFEQRRKDFLQLVVHHIATVTLVFVSYWFRYHRIGLIILLTHNISDVFLYGGKALHYAAKKYKHLNVYVQGIFVLFAVSFFCTRLVFFPFVVIKSSYTEFCDIIPGCPFQREGSPLLLVLFGLHCFWFYLIMRTAVATFNRPKEEFEDICSESDSDGENIDGGFCLQDLKKQA